MWKKNFNSFQILCFSFSISLILLSVVSIAQPIAPHAFWGTATYDGGGNIPDGTEIAVKLINGTKIASTTVSNGRYGYSPNVLKVPNPSPYTTLYFFIVNIDTTQTAEWVSMGTTELDLTIIGDVTPPTISSVSASSITSSRATVSWTTDEDSNSTVNYGLEKTNLNLSALSSSMVTSHSIDLTGLSASTTYYYEVVSSDSNGNTATDDNFGNYYNFSTSAPTTTTTTTPGGGGGAAVVAVEVTKTIITASPQTPATVTIEAAKAADLKVDEITIDVKETITNMQVTVKESSLPAGANVAISTDIGATYKYIEITTNVASSKIEKAKIKFKVEKSWITSKNIDTNTIVLQRYAENKWNKLQTTKTSEDATYYYFEATTPGFSVFAVTGEKKIAAVCGNNIQEGAEECDGTDLAEQTCISLGLYGGTLRCRANCQFDTSQCTTAPEPVCGDGVCGANETYETCPQDCPAPTPPEEVCGDGVCGEGETYETCPQDCPVPPVPLYYYAVVIIIIIIILGGFYYKFKKKTR